MDLKKQSEEVEADDLIEPDNELVDDQKAIDDGIDDGLVKDVEE